MDGAVLLLSTLIYLTTVEHEIVGSGVWNYQLWSDAQPVRIYRNGERQPLDVYQRLVNANFNLNVHRTPLMSDFSSLALDGDGADAFRRFRSDLADLQRDGRRAGRLLADRAKDTKGQHQRVMGRITSHLVSADSSRHC